MLRALASGVRRPETLADKALGTLRKKIPELTAAFEGRPDAHFEWMLNRLLQKLDWLDAELAGIDGQLDERMRDYDDLIRRLDTIPRVDVVGQAVIAETGTDMTRFSDAAHLASWAGLRPGNAESAGKRFPGAPEREIAICGGSWFRAPGPPRIS